LLGHSTTAVLPAAVVGHSTLRTNLASQNAPSVTAGRGGNEVDCAAVWTSPAVDFEPGAAVEDRDWLLPDVDDTPYSSGKTGSNADVVHGNFGTATTLYTLLKSSQVAFNI